MGSNLKLWISNMGSGGKRDGAGRKPSGPDTVPVNWRVSESAKKWMKGKAVEDGVSIGAVLDKLIKHYEVVNFAAKTAIVATDISHALADWQQKINAKLTAEAFKPNQLPDNLYEFHIERMKLQRCYKLGLPAKINGKVVRVISFSEWYDPYAKNELKISFEVVPMEGYDEREILEIDISKFQ